MNIYFKRDPPDLSYSSQPTLCFPSLIIHKDVSFLEKLKGWGDTRPGKDGGTHWKQDKITVTSECWYHNLHHCPARMLLARPTPSRQEVGRVFSGARDQPRGKNQPVGFPVSQPMRPPIAEALLDRPPLSLLEHIAKDHQTLKGSLGYRQWDSRQKRNKKAKKLEGANYEG